MDEYTVATIHGTYMPPALGSPLGGLEEEVSKDAKTPETRVPATRCPAVGGVELRCMTDETRESPFYRNILTWQIHLGHLITYLGQLITYLT